MKDSNCISVIVPVYKAEAYIDKCIQDILAQTFKDFELLLVLDGSFDKSEEICDKWALQDSRIKVLKDQHAGVAHTRQVGLDNAVGEYIQFIDADDSFTEDFLELMYKAAIKNNADIVICDYEEKTQYSTNYCCQEPTSLNMTAVMDDIISNKLYGALWNKLLRTECIRKCQASFPSYLHMREDVAFLATAAEEIKKVAYIPQALYTYNRQNVNALTNNYLDESVDYYRQEIMWNKLMLQNHFISEISKTNILHYYTQLAYITLKKGLLDKTEWFNYFLPFKGIMKYINLGYKSKIVAMALNGNFIIAQFLRTLVAKLR